MLTRRSPPPFWYVHGQLPQGFNSAQEAHIPLLSIAHSYRLANIQPLLTPGCSVVNSGGSTGSTAATSGSYGQARLSQHLRRRSTSHCGANTKSRQLKVRAVAVADSADGSGKKVVIVGGGWAGKFDTAINEPHLPRRAQEACTKTRGLVRPADDPSNCFSVLCQQLTQVLHTSSCYCQTLQGMSTRQEKQ